MKVGVLCFGIAPLMSGKVHGSVLEKGCRNTVSTFQKQVIKSIKKQSKMFIKNWRPISILNAGLKYIKILIKNQESYVVNGLVTTK